MYGYIYKIQCLINGKLYIGKHKYNKPYLDEKYIASGILINQSIKKYGIDNFTNEIIDIADNLEELNEKEIYWIKTYNTISPNGYNLTAGGDGISEPTIDVRQKMREKKLGKLLTEEHKQKIGLSGRNLKKPKEWVEKIKIINKGKKPAKNTIEKSIERHKNTKWYNNGEIEIMVLEEDIPNLSPEYKKGRLKNYFPLSKGKPLSQEMKNKIGKSKKDTCWINNGEIERMIKKDSELPENFVYGRLKK